MVDTYLHWLNKRGFDCNDLECRAFNGNTPLLQAALEGNTLVAARLIEAGANLYAVNSDFNGVLFNACVADEPNLIELLVRSGADINDVNEYNETALMYAVSASKRASVIKLIELGADTTVTNIDGLCAADYAVDIEVLHLFRYARAV